MSLGPPTNRKPPPGAPVGGWQHVGRREGFWLWKHSDGRRAVTPAGSSPDPDKLRPWWEFSPGANQWAIYMDEGEPPKYIHIHPDVYPDAHDVTKLDWLFSDDWPKV